MVHEGEVLCLELTEDLLIEKINDTRNQFGHGYVIASILADIQIERYCIYNDFNRAKPRRKGFFMASYTVIMFVFNM
jgi:hypothetical protein